MSAISGGPNLLGTYAIDRTFYMASSAEGDNAQVIYAGPCAVFSVDCYNTGPAGLRLGFFDKNSAPTPSDTPKWVIYLSGQDEGSKDWPIGLSFQSGMAIDVMSEQPGVLVPGVLESLNIGYRVY